MTDILIIGGGVIGVSAAFYLAERGARVTVLERGEIASGASYGNAGLVVPSHSVPLAEPGAIVNGFKWMFNPTSPFYIKPRADRDLAEWLLAFVRASTPTRMRQGITVLKELGLASRALYDELAQLGFDFGYETRGLLKVFVTEQGLAHGAEEAHLLNEYALGVQVLDRNAVHALEPNLKEAVLGGLLFPQDAHLNPAQFVRALAQEAEKRGVQLKTNVGVVNLEAAGPNITRVITTAGDFTAEQVVLAGGSWSPNLGRALKLNIPIQAAKGYSVMLKRPAQSPTYPLLLGETWVAVTPLGEQLRLAGTLELAGLDMTVNQKRLENVRHGAQNYLFDTEQAETLETWRGLRPCTPDGLPIIGRSSKYRNLILATGHAMVGISLGPITGKLVAQVACGQPPAIDLHPLRVERF